MAWESSLVVVVGLLSLVEMVEDDGAGQSARSGDGCWRGRCVGRVPKGEPGGGGSGGGRLFARGK